MPKDKLRTRLTYKVFRFCSDASENKQCYWLVVVQLLNYFLRHYLFERLLNHAVLPFHKKLSDQFNFRIEIWINCRLRENASFAVCNYTENTDGVRWNYKEGTFASWAWKLVIIVSFTGMGDKIWLAPIPTYRVSSDTNGHIPREWRRVTTKGKEPLDISMIWWYTSESISFRRKKIEIT